MAYIDDIFKRFLDNSCTEDEVRILLRYFELDEYSDKLRELVEHELLKTIEERDIPKKIDKMVDDNLHILLDKMETARNRRNRSIRLLITISVAASIVIVSTLAIRYFSVDPEIKVAEAAIEQDIDPGTNRATLFLEDGESFVLDEDRAAIQVGTDGIFYDDGTKIVENKAVQYVVLAVPRKGQYQTVLPDGTRVWLNAESSLRYPTAFTGNERLVELRGEAFFEVAHNVAQPFIVEAGSQQLRVLGTQFNINAYDNEPAITTTLVDGSIELRSTTTSAVRTIKPEQQAILGADGFQITTVDVEPYTAWKNGEFRFKATPLHEALRQIERWYDVEIDYTHIPDNIKVHSSTKRDKKMSSVLFAVEKITGLKFQVKERSVQLMR